jgi:general secretion pathway protein D
MPNVLRNKLTLTIAIALFLQTANPSSSFAQFDDEDFDAPPPPPGMGSDKPISDMDLFDSPPANRGSSPSGSKKAGSPAMDAGKSTTQKFSNAGIEDINNKNFPEMIDNFDFPNADITDLVKVMSELTGKNFIIDPGVRGKISIVAPSKVTVAEAYKAFLSALSINGFAVVPTGKFWKIRSARNAQRDGIETYSGNYYPNSDQMITRIIHLKHINADLVNRELRMLQSKDGEIAPYSPTNSLIISDYGSNIERIMKILSQLDIPGFEDQLQVIPIRYAKAKDIAELVNKIVNKDAKNSGGGGGGSFTAGVPRFSRSGGTSTQGTSSAYFMVIPDDRTNSLVVVGNKAGIERVRKLITQLDFRIRPEDQGGVFVYTMKYGEAKKIAQTLSGIAKDSAPKASSGSGAPTISPIGGVQAQQEIFGGDVKVTADETTNTLVIVASKQDYEVILNLLNKLDIQRDQVFVEAIIMEMKMGDAFDWQVGYLQYDKNGSGAKMGFNGFDGGKLQDLLSPTGGTGAILGFASGDSVKIKPAGGTEVTLPSIISFVNFIKKNTNSNVLSTPQILALDNQEAVIEVGDKVVVGSTSTSSNGVTTETPQFEDATIKLKIKPFISSASNTVRMELESSVKQKSSFTSPEGLKNKVQPLATRSVKTNIVVPDGDTAVLGGLMKEDDFESVSKVPLLGDIPVIGWLFKSRSTNKEKINMLIFLTPKIIHTKNDNKELLSRKVEQRQKYIKNAGGRDPYGSTIDEIMGQKAAPVDEKKTSKTNEDSETKKK